MTRTQVKLPAETILRYIERRRTDLDVCRSALQTGDFSKVETIGHQLKGNAATFGFPDLGLVGADIEKAGKDRDADLLAQNTIRLEGWLASLGSQPAL